MAKYEEINVTSQFLDNTPDCFFIFGDNLVRTGCGGAARLRFHPKAIGFITKKYPDNLDNSFYRPTEYATIFFEELAKLEKQVKENLDKTFYISKLGAGLANKYYIWEKVINHNLVKALEKYNNVVFCWEENFVK